MLLCIYFATMSNVPWTFLPWYSSPAAETVTSGTRSLAVAP